MISFMLAGATGIIGICTGVAAETKHTYLAALGTIVIIILMNIVLFLEKKLVDRATSSND
jgi:hypothetical protein